MGTESGDWIDAEQLQSRCHEKSIFPAGDQTLRPGFVSQPIRPGVPGFDQVGWD